MLLPSAAISAWRSSRIDFPDRPATRLLSTFEDWISREELSSARAIINSMQRRGFGCRSARSASRHTFLRKVTTLAVTAEGLAWAAAFAGALAAGLPAAFASGFSAVAAAATALSCLATILVLQPGS